MGLVLRGQLTDPQCGVTPFYSDVGELIFPSRPIDCCMSEFEFCLRMTAYLYPRRVLTIGCHAGCKDR